MRARLAGFAFVVTTTLVPVVARAQDAAAAEALFQTAHQLFEQKRYAEACPKFAESYKLDPVSGALLALASCHEAEGKLASAWVEYLDVAKRARDEGKNDRADAAQQRAGALEPKLAKLTITLAPGAQAIADLQVKRDGVAVGAATFGTPLPVDRGDHVIEVSAPGRLPFVRRVSMNDGASEAVVIPVLTPAGQAAVPPQTTPAPESTPEEQPSKSPTRTIGIVATVAGVVVMGIGGYFGIKAINKNKDSNDNNHCVNDACDPVGKSLRNDAVSTGKTSTALFVTGGLLAGAGVVLILVGGSSSAADPKPGVALVPAASPQAAGLSLDGRF